MELEEEPIPLPLLSQLLYEAETGGLDKLTQEKINKVLSSYTLTSTSLYRAFISSSGSRCIPCNT